MEYKTIQKQMILYKIQEEFIADSIYLDVDVPLHTHNHYEIELVTDGSGSQVFDGMKFSLSPKDIYLVGPNDQHVIYTHNMTLQRLKIKESSLPKWIVRKLQNLNNPKVYHLSEEDYQTFKTLMVLLAKEFRSDHSNFLETASLLSELIFTYFFRLDKDNENWKNEDFVEKVMHYLEHNRKFTEKVTLEEIAAYTGYSKYYTSSMFHKNYKMTLQDFITYLRIDYAKQLLRDTNYSISQINKECGFSTASSFYPQFVKIVGCSPLQYRRKMIEEKKNLPPEGEKKEIIDKKE